jgi:hypothetical protein
MQDSILLPGFESGAVFRLGNVDQRQLISGTRRRENFFELMAK